MRALARLLDQVRRLKPKTDEQTHKSTATSILNKLMLISAPPGLSS
jgi:hypothetical protein